MLEEVDTMYFTDPSSLCMTNQPIKIRCNQSFSCQSNEVLQFRVSRKIGRARVEAVQQPPPEENHLFAKKYVTFVRPPLAIKRYPSI
jgi:hypothetical protein